MAQTSLLSLFLLFLLLQTGAALELMAPPTHRATLGADTLIPCTFQVETPPVDPRHLAIFWSFQDKEILNVTSTVGRSNPRLSLNRETIRAGVASLSIANVEISDGGLYRCSVLYSPDMRYKEVRLDIQAPPRITLTNNIVIKDKESTLSAAITGFYPVDIDIKWLREGEILAGGTELPPQRNADGTYRVTSTVTIVPTEGNRNQSFSIRVQHESLSAPLQEDFQLLYGALPSAAILYEPFKLNVQQILTCRVWGFCPEYITVNWFVNGTRVESATVQRVNGSAVESKFLFLPEAETRGTELHCVVQHKTLPEPLVRTLLVQIPEPDQNHSADIVTAVISTLLIAGLMFTLICYIIQKRRGPGAAASFMWGPEKLLHNVEAQLHYTVSYYSENVKITWWEERPGSTKQMISAPSKNSEEELLLPLLRSSSIETISAAGNPPYIYRSDLRFRPRVKDHKGVQFTCRIACNRYSKEDTYMCNVLAKPRCEQNIGLSLEEDGYVLCSLSLKEFYPKDIEISWKCSKGNKDNQSLAHTEQYKENEEGTFSAHSACRVLARHFNNPDFKVWASWKHQSIDGEETLYVTDASFPSPEVGEIERGDVYLKKKAELQLKILNCFPVLTKVNWFRKDHGEWIPVETTMSRKRPINGSSCTAYMEFTENSISEPQFKCEVKHPNMKGSAERSTGALRVLGRPEIEDIKIINGLENSFSLTVRDHFPKFIFIQWKLFLEDNCLEHLPSYLETINISNGSFKTVSKCTPPGDKISSNEKYKITAEVQHEALKTPVHKPLEFEKKVPAQPQQTQDIHRRQVPDHGGT